MNHDIKSKETLLADALAQLPEDKRATVCAHLYGIVIGVQMDSLIGTQRNLQKNIIGSMQNPSKEQTGADAV